MTKYDFILLSGDMDDFLKKLQSAGVVDITRSVKPIDDKSETLSQRAETLRRALSLLKGVEESRPETLKSVNPADDVVSINRNINEIQEKIALLTKEVETSKPWGQFDNDTFERLGDLGLKLHFYKVKTTHFDETWQEQYNISVISTDESYTYFVVIAENEDFSFPMKEEPAPTRSYTAVEDEITKLNNELATDEQRLTELKSREDDIRAELNKTITDLDFYLAGASATKTAENYITVIEGFAPTENESDLKQMLDNEPVYYLVDKAKEADNPPIKLKNNKFVSMFEVLTDMYGRPKYGEFDPTVWISVFFMLFFAFCMGDAGYGLVLILAGLALKKALGKLTPLVITLGIATTVIGFFFHTFFSTEMLDWKTLPDTVKSVMLPAKIGGYDGTMVLAILVGIVHLCLAMIVKTYQSTKTKGFVNSLSTWGWTLLIVGGVIVGGLALIGVLDSAVTKWIIIGLGILSAIGIFLLNDIHRNPLINIGSGLWETYNTATGLLGDVLSYLRLYALGLAGAQLGVAFNTIGVQALGDGGVGGWIAFILIVVVGHTLNVAMCVLGAFVHPLRLNFLEFFKNSGYEGSGRVYKPLTEKEINN